MKSELEKQRKTKPIRNWIVEERPREMLIKQGAENINPAKLLAIIMVHNHPSGEPEPSNEDIAITKRVVDACNLMDIKVLDHIVIGKNKGDYVSLMDRGLIKGA